VPGDEPELRLLHAAAASMARLLAHVGDVVASGAARFVGGMPPSCVNRFGLLACARILDRPAP